MASKDVSNQLDDIENEVKEHTKILASVDKTLALQAQQLESHMQRTALAEENLKLLRADFKPVEEQSIFIKKFVRVIVILGGLGASLGGMSTAVYYILRLLGKA